MDVGNRNDWQLARVVPSQELLARIAERWPTCTPLDPAYRGEVARRYAFDDGSGEIGFIVLGNATILRRLHARAPVLGRQAVHLPVRGRGRGSAGAAARGRHPTSS